MKLVVVFSRYLSSFSNWATFWMTSCSINEGQLGNRVPFSSFAERTDGR